MNTAPSEEEIRRKQLVPNATDEEILKSIKATYPEDVKDVSILKKLESYDDLNLLVQLDLSDSNEPVLCLAKVYNGVESGNYIKASKEAEGDTDKKNALSSIHLYEAIFSHLNQPKYNVKTSSPLAIGGTNGRSIHTLPVTSKEHSPAPLVLQLLTWVEGSTMASTKTLSIETLAEAGHYLGKVCHALDDLTKGNEVARKTADRYHAWDGKNTLDIEKFLYCIDDERRRKLVQSVLDSFRKELIEEGEKKPEFRKGITQGDFNDANILLGGDGKVSGVIDFGDTTFSWRVLDISIAMAYSMMSTYGKSNRAISAAAAILRGFHSIYPLTPIEQKHLRLLVASRLSCSATLGAYSYQQNPENKYLLVHAEPAWKTLELVWGGDITLSNAIDSAFHMACNEILPSPKEKDDGDNGKIDVPIIDCTDISFPDPCVVDILQSVRKKSSLSLVEEPPRKRARADNGLPIITFVTGNKKKLEEVKRILASSNGDSSSGLPFHISNEKIDLPELQGDPLEIAKEKCTLAAKEVGGAVITEDTSLCFNALQGMPGPYIKWFLEKCGHDGLNNMISSSEDKSGYAQTVVGFCQGPGEEVMIFDGRTQGKIVPARGPLDFGWDPIFQPDEGGELTYAEMTKEGKDAISHRSRAFQGLREYLMKNSEELNSVLK